MCVIDDKKQRNRAVYHMQRGRRGGEIISVPQIIFNRFKKVSCFFSFYFKLAIDNFFFRLNSLRSKYQ